jgi:putative transposase
MVSFGGARSQYTRTPFYGVRRMASWLGKQGYGVNVKRVRRLLRQMGLEAIYPRPRLSVPGPGHRIYPYRLRGLKIDRPNQVWGSDITYIRLRQGFIYLVAILDWFSRYVVAWEVSVSLEGAFCLAALEWALKTTCPEIFNSDQGAQFTSEAFTKRLEERGITISMDGRGRAMDNIFVERLWRSVKYEEVYLKDYERMSEAVTNLRNYFLFYNCASLCPPRYVADKSRSPWSCTANARARLCPRVRSTSWAAVPVSSPRRLRTQGPSGSGCSASISPRSMARRSVIPLTPK